MSRGNALVDAGGCLEKAGALGIESLATAGKALAKASEAFAVSWDETAEEFYLCADALDSAAADVESSASGLTVFLKLAAEEMRGASEVSGCLSAAPAAAAPNFIAFGRALADAATHAADKHPVLGRHFSEASLAIARFVAAVEGS
jgi:hypothetical protein